MHSACNVLEVGSRDVNGSTREILAAFSESYVGVDIFDGPGVDKLVDVNDLMNSFGHESFDVVTSTEMLEHCANWQDAIYQMAGVLRPGGLLLITTRSPGFELHDYPADYWRFSKSDFEEIFRPIGNILALQSDMTLGWPCGVGILLRKTANLAQLDAWHETMKGRSAFSMIENSQENQPNTDNRGRIIFDQYSRYKACADLLRQAGFAAGNSVLDIGSGPECLFGQFMPDAEMTYVDPLIPAGSGQGRIAGDVFSGELDGRQFDCVSSVDVLEHIPPDKRNAFVERLSSLAGKRLVLAFPGADRGDALSVDQFIADAYRQTYGRDYSWLDEHFNYSLPSLDAVLGHLGALGWHCQVIKHGYAPWLRELLRFTVCAWEIPEGHDLVLNISERFNRELYGFDFGEPEYRQFIIATREPLNIDPSTFSRPMTVETQAKFDALMADAWNGLLPVLAQVARDRGELSERQADTQRKLMETSEWGQALQVHLEFSNKLVLESNAKVEELTKQFTAKHAELMEMSGWAYGMMLELERRNSPIVTRGKLLVKRSVTFIRRQLARTLLGDVVRHLRDRRRCREKRVSIEALQQSLKDNHGRLVIVFPVITWDFRWQRPQHIVSRLRDHGYSVLYLAMSLTAQGRRFRGDKDAIAEARFDELDRHINQIWLSTSKQLNIYTDPLEGDDLHNLSAGLGALISELRPKSIKYLVQFPGWWPAVKECKERLGGRVIFDCMDDHGGFSTNTKQALETEEALVNSADLVITSSDLLEQRAKQVNPNTIQIKNGTEFEHFANPRRNGELDHLCDRPVIGYYGAISDWFDMEIVAYCARKHLDWNFVLIGATFGADLRLVEGLENVHLLGEKPYKDLPGYFAYFDVCTIPFKIIPLTLATNPVKFYEYLSAGKPVVAVELPELIPYREDCYLARNADEFLAQLEQAYAERDDEKKIERRIKLASENSWDSRVRDILESSKF